MIQDRVMRAASAVGLLALSLGGTACTKQQILPATIAGVGGATMVGGFIYSAALPEGTGFWGEDAGDSAAIGGLVFGGLALSVVGVLFSITSADCEADDDCWSGDVCELGSHTCVAADAIPAAQSPASPVEGETEGETTAPPPETERVAEPAADAPPVSEPTAEPPAAEPEPGP